ncbi:MAG: hypothetical protein AAGA50_25925 [Pseudomonadota bacterium]
MADKGFGQRGAQRYSSQNPARIQGSTQSTAQLRSQFQQISAKDTKFVPSTNQGPVLGLVGWLAGAGTQFCLLFADANFDRAVAEGGSATLIILALAAIGLISLLIFIGFAGFTLFTFSRRSRSKWLLGGFLLGMASVSIAM